MLTLTLLRHGAVDERPFVLWGQSDLPVSADGWRAMEQAITDRVWAGVLTSPLRRCRDFAQQLHPPAHILNDMREMHFGDWQGRTPEELLREDGVRYQAFMQNPETHTPPSGESLAHFRARALHTLLAWRNTQPQGDWLCITHGGVIRVLLQEWLGLRDHWRIAVPCATTLQFLLPEGGDPVLRSLTPPCVN